MKRYLSKSKLLLFCFLISAAFLAVCSKSSPLYPMNDWVDVQCFLTLGKGLLNGLIPYVDLYEQKGPLLYMIYALVALFSRENMLGQYLLEVITFGLFLYYSAKIAQLHLGQSFLVYLIPAVLAGVIGTTLSFSHGGSVEQLCLFTFTYGLYTVMKACREGRGLSRKEALVNGLFAAGVFWIKYTMVGFYIGLAIFILIWYLYWLREPKALLHTIGWFLAGVGIVTAGVVGFCLVTASFGKMMECYFYNNLFLYPSESETPLLEQIRDQFHAAMGYNDIFPLFIYLGLAYLLIRAKECPKDLWAVALSMAGLVFFTFMGMGYSYYALTISAFSVFGLIGIAKLLRRIPVPRSVPGYGILASTTVVLFSVLCLTQAFCSSKNVYLMYHDREELPPYRFAQTINKTEGATLLNFGFLDGGFYYAADVLPNCPFFCTFNVEAPGMWETQYEYIREGKVDYVVTRHYTLESYYVDSSKYALVDQANFYFEGVDFTYYLYQLKE